MYSSIKQLAIHWLLGLIGSTILVWLFTPFFLESLKVYKHDPNLDMFVRDARHPFQKRREGWATTKFQDFGIVGFQKDSESQQNILIWGDSHVEALHVADEKKLAQKATQLLSEQNVTCYAVARAGYDVVDYVELIPRYNREIPTKLNVIVISTWDDFMPNGKDYLAHPNFEIIQGMEPPRHHRIKQFVVANQLEPFYWLAFNTAMDPNTKSTRKLRFSLGPVETAKLRIPKEFDVEVLRETWRLLIDHLEEISAAPIAFVYTPTTPFIESRGTVFDDPDGHYVSLFRDVCREKNLPFVDVTSEFNALVRESAQFPRGFHNGRISRGHFNEAGHRIIAEAIAQLCHDWD